MKKIKKVAKDYPGALFLCDSSVSRTDRKDRVKSDLIEYFKSFQFGVEKLCAPNFCENANRINNQFVPILKCKVNSLRKWSIVVKVFLLIKDSFSMENNLKTTGVWMIIMWLESLPFTLFWDLLEIEKK